MSYVSHAIAWSLPRQPCADWNQPDDVVVWVSVSKLDKAWQLDRDFYIGPGGSGAAIDDRYDQFGKWLSEECCSVELAVVAIDEGCVSFTDGRHRFAWLRDHGVLAMPVQVDASQELEFKRRFGTDERSSTITLDGEIRILKK